MTQLTHPNSPLAQARKPQRVSMARSAKPLSLRDQGILKRVLEEKYE